MQDKASDNIVKIAAYVPRDMCLPIARKHWAKVSKYFASRSIGTGGPLNSTLAWSGMVCLLKPVGDTLYMELEINCGPNAGVKENDRLVLGFRNLFTGRISRYTQPTGYTISAGKIGRPYLAIPVEKLKLRPSHYHVKVDLQRKGKSLCGGFVGSTEIYIQAPGESPYHIKGCYIMGQTEYYRCYETGRKYMDGHLRGFSPLIPPTLDPFNEITRHDYLKAYVRTYPIHAEIQMHLGLSMVYAARALGNMGDLERAAFAEQRAVALCAYMFRQMLPKGAMNSIVVPYLERWPDLKPEECKAQPTVDTDQMGCYLMVAGNTIRYLHERKHRPALQKELLFKAMKAVRYLNRAGWDEHAMVGCGFHRYHAPAVAAADFIRHRRHVMGHPQCALYEGRILAGLGEVLRAQLAVAGSIPRDLKERFLGAAVAAAEMSLLSEGEYDRWCHCEPASDAGYMMCGLVPALILARRLGEKEAAQKIYYGIMALVEHLYRWSTAKDRTNWPFCSWLGSMFYIACRDFLDNAGEDARIRAAMETAALRLEADMLGSPGGTTKAHGSAIMADLLFSSKEWKSTPAGKVRRAVAYLPPRGRLSREQRQNLETKLYAIKEMLAHKPIIGVRSYLEGLPAAVEKLLKTHRCEEVEWLLTGALSKRLRHGEDEGFIPQWHVIGPFDNPQKGGRRTGLANRYPVEKEIDFGRRYVGKNGQKVSWKKMSLRKMGYLDLLAEYPEEKAVAYAYTELYSPSDRPAQLLFGSDDGAHIYVNEELVYNKLIDRSAVMDEERIEIILRQGKNRILVKVEQHIGGWGFFLRISQKKN